MMNAAGLSTVSCPTGFSYLHGPPDVDLGEFTAFEGGYSAANSNFDFNDGLASSCDLGTISPTELQLQESFVMSAPNSTSFTHLTSPSLGDGSPAFDSYDVSPNFGSADFGDTSADWYPLFPGDAQQGVPSVDVSPSTQSEDIEGGNRSGNGSGARRKTSASGSPNNGSTRHSSVSGVNSRKRDKPLPPIIIDDPTDVTAMKRARNTLAARKSRERKAQRFEDLEDRIAKLEAERDHWKKIALAQAGQQN